VPPVVWCAAALAVVLGAFPVAAIADVPRALLVLGVLAAVAALLVAAAAAFLVWLVGSMSSA
jgi:hypothetical protein